MSLFDGLDRADTEPALYAEPEFAFLNRSARPEARRVRAVIEEWFGRFPVEHRDDLRIRLRSDDDTVHKSAFFELLLHELLVRLDCQVTIHPTPDNDTTRHPDFLVLSPEGDKFYLEAVLATDESREKTAEKARMNAVYDVLNRLESRNFFIGMSLRGAPKTPPPARRMRSFLRQQIAYLDADTVASSFEAEGVNGLPRWKFDHDGWRIEFFPIPKTPDARSEPGIRPLALWVGDAVWVTTKKAIRNAVLEKAGRYGSLDLPYVIAVNSLGWPTDREDIVDALIGDTQYVINLADPSALATTTRKHNGASTSGRGPRYTRVSAVLLFNGVSAWRIPAAGVCLYHNPWAARPYDSRLNRLPQAKPADERLEWLEGESLGKLFELPDGWPEI